MKSPVVKNFKKIIFIKNKHIVISSSQLKSQTNQITNGSFKNKNIEKILDDNKAKSITSINLKNNLYS